MYPHHIAIIMDGNRRWAKSNSCPLNLAYEKGVETLYNSIDECIKYKIKYLTVFGFSTENWKRSKKEISYLLGLFNKFLDKAIIETNDRNIRIRFIGNLTEFDEKLQNKIKTLTNLSKLKKGLILTIAVNYGGRHDIIQAVNNCIRKGIKKITLEKDFERYLLNYKTPSIDLLIRTGGEKRLSNFMLWDLAYTELIFLSEMWPDFNSDLLTHSINEFISRKRNFGGR